MGRLPPGPPEGGTVSVFGTVGHLARRFATSLSRRPPAADDLAWAHAMLLPSEAALWDRMTAQDRRHSILVARRFVERLPDATRPEVAAALLHDVGKLEAGLGTFARVAATVVGPRGGRFRAYHDHEAIGAGLLADAGSDTVTVSLVTGHGRAAEVLRAADDV